MKKYIINEIANDVGFSETLAKVLSRWFQHIGLNNSELIATVGEIILLCRQDKSQEQIERELTAFLYKQNLVPKINEKLLNRAELVYSHIANKAVGNSYLEIGAGDGKVAELVSREGKSVTLLDVLDFNETNLRLVKYDGKKMPFGNDIFDTSSMLMVLHHCDNPLQVLDEAIRVTKKRIIIIESVYANEEEKKINTFVDWFWNRVFHEGINVPLNFKMPQEWLEIFEQKSLKLIENTDLGLDLEMAPEHHWLYVLEK